MKVSLNNIRKMNRTYGSTDDVAAIGIEQLIDRIGSQLGGVEGYQKIGPKYAGIVIAKIVSCVQHPNADKLQICMVDDGGVIKNVERDDKGLVQVVCGAPNARAGITVAWLPPNSTVPSSFDDDPFVLEARQLRGETSNGMLASPKELTLNDNHDGILEIDGERKVGSDFAEIFGLKDDIILELENKMFTHRPDCFGFLGIARELAGIQALPYTSPGWYTPNPDFPNPEAELLPLTIRNELPDLVPRFTAVTMSNVRVGPSPVWLQVELAKLGQKSISNIVDYTNWFMLETGQPLHAYDYDKVKALSAGEATIVVRNPLPKENITLLNGKQITPRSGAIMIATDKVAIGVGGVMGGSETEVDGKTTNIILESANFNMYSIRRTSMAHGLFTDAVTRFNKGQSPLQNKAVLAQIVDTIRQHAGGKVAGPLLDSIGLPEAVVARQSLYEPIELTADFINARLGSRLTADDIAPLLQNVEFGVEVNDQDQDQDQNQTLHVTAPFWRTDIELPEDIVEEVGRLYGYHKLPLSLPVRPITPTAKSDHLALKAQIRSNLAIAGANEVLTYSFVHGDLLQKVGQDASKAFQVSNALSPDLQYYRLSLLPSLLDKVHANIKAGYDQFALFELGKTHAVDQIDNLGLPFEFERTAMVFAANDKLKKSGAAFYEAREFLLATAGIRLDFKPVNMALSKDALVQPYNLDRTAIVCLPGTGDILGIIGEFKPAVSRALKLPKYCAGFEVDTILLGEALAANRSYRPLPRFPKVSQDITLKVPSKVAYQLLFETVWEHIISLQPDNSLPTLRPIDIYQKADDLDHRQISLRLTLANYERTLTDLEVNKLLDNVAAATKNELGAERI